MLAGKALSDGFEGKAVRFQRDAKKAQTLAKKVR
jgi:hypothetical protein